MTGAASIHVQVVAYFYKVEKFQVQHCSELFDPYVKARWSIQRRQNVHRLYQPIRAVRESDGMQWT